MAERIAKGKELLDASCEKTLEALRGEFADALEELRTAREEADYESHSSDGFSEEHDSVPETSKTPDYNLEDCF